MRNLFLIICLFLLQACADKSDENLSKMIVGTWAYNFISGSYGFIEYASNGDKCEMNFSFDQNGELSIELYWNKWKIEDGVIKSETHATTTVFLEKGFYINK